MTLIMDIIAALGLTVVQALPAAADLHAVEVPHAAAVGAEGAAVRPNIGHKKKGLLSAVPFAFYPTQDTPSISFRLSFIGGVYILFFN